MITDINQLDLNKTYSYADYLTWQFQEKLELIKGKIFKMSPAPSTTHQRISMELAGMLYIFFKPHPCNLFAAPFDVRLMDKKNRD
ncbi:Uma2 family endonuclease [Flavobacterium sp. FPG59]|jgi:Uma2 family endonuclease|uniref:Uma2 family endonuclease n=1 Tax=Flavobacterium sp. FPG59 TaxID=1929267 RepID=UPI0026C9911F